MGRAALLIVIAALGWPVAARAGGFEIPDNGARAVGRGGAYTAAAADLTALYYNPGALTRLRGTRALWSHNVVFHDVTFQRAPVADGWDVADSKNRFKTARDSASPFALGGFVAGSTDLGLDDWVFAAGVYGPSSVGRHDYPDYGPQSFMLTEMDIMILYYSVAAAWEPVPDTFGVGLTLQWVDMPKLQYELNIDSSLSFSSDDVDPISNADGTQLLAKIDLADRTGFTAIAGAWWRFLPAWELAVAGRFLPVQLSPTGGVEVDKPTLVTQALSAELPITLPVQVRGGLRLVQPRFDVELDVFWENWSAIENFDVKFDGAINGVEVADLTLPKAYRDTVSVRLGGDYQAIPGALDLRAGGFWENGAVPDNYSHLDFPSFDRLGVGGGLTATYWRLAFTVAYLHIFQEDREVDERFGKVLQERPLRGCPDDCGGLSGVVANAGTFQSSYDLVSFAVDAQILD